jgi:hypothetical protein
VMAAVAADACAMKSRRLSGGVIWIGLPSIGFGRLAMGGAPPGSGRENGRWGDSNRRIAVLP